MLLSINLFQFDSPSRDRQIGCLPVMIPGTFYLKSKCSAYTYYRNYCFKSIQNTNFLETIHNFMKIIPLQNPIAKNHNQKFFHIWNLTVVCVTCLYANYPFYSLFRGNPTKGDLSTSSLKTYSTVIIKAAALPLPPVGKQFSNTIFFLISKSV